MELTKKQYNQVIVVDGLSKFYWFYPTKRTGADEVVERLQKQAEVFVNPIRALTDRGTAFTAKVLL